VTEGDTFTHEFAPIQLPDLVRYAGASGDFNPSHYDRDLAVSAGFKTNFAHGMFTAGLLGVLVAERFGPERIRSFGVRFVAPLWCGQAPRAEAKVASIRDGLARLELRVLAGDREVVRGWADILTEARQSA